MNIAEINDYIHFDSKETLVKALLYLKLMERGICVSHNILNILALYAEKSDKDEVIQEALDRKFARTWQVGENVTSFLAKKNLLLKPDKKIRKINPEFFGELPADYIAATYKIHNLKLS